MYGTELGMLPDHLINLIRSSAIIVSLILLPGTGQAQKCKFKIDRKDPLTGEHIVAEGIRMGGGIGIGVGKVGDKPEISITLTYPHDRSFKVEPGNLMITKLANGDTLHYRNTNTATPVTFVASPGTSTTPPVIKTQYTLTYAVDQRFYPLLSEHMVELFRVHVNDQAIDITVDAKDGDKIKKYSACLK
ncbi:MAG: hypothetical protein IPJ87_15725 [Flavobacteriales bacterium]|jgi:hypothetical protein|nr:hypothetical protein [Flavobacteriales bacterium]MBK7943298.1 hypothetical protein [Flavobacteriales bacterium]MBK9700013.1 hypothetical protein [Flavobacteriales bacterium]